MSSYDLRISEDDFRKLEELLWEREGVESAAFLLAGVQRNGGRTALLGRRVVKIPASEYDVRTNKRIELSTRAINGLAALCEANGLTAVLCHSHPMDISYSPSDDHGERRIAATLRQITEIPEVGSLLLTPESQHGRLWRGDPRDPDEFNQLVIVGSRLRKLQLHERKQTSLPSRPDIHDRQIRAFGEEGQALLEDAKVGVVGVGGTGSPLAEQLVRLGVRDLAIIDKDEFQDSNLSRMYGTFHRHVQPGFLDRLRGQSTRKVDIVRDHLKKIAPTATIRTYDGNVASPEATTELLDRDVIFTCTDDHWGRSVINQIAYQYLIPVINIGVALDSDDDGEITAGNGVVQVLRPGQPCLWCAEHLDSERIAAESLPEDRRQDRVEEGYLRGLNDQVPSVVSLTTTIAGLAATWFLQLMTGFMGRAGGISRQNYFMLEGRVRRASPSKNDECVCRRYRGFGDLKNLPV